jgi:hypothetical protein
MLVAKRVRPVTRRRKSPRRDKKTPCSFTESGGFLIDLFSSLVIPYQPRWTDLKS